MGKYELIVKVKEAMEKYLSLAETVDALDADEALKSISHTHEVWRRDLPIAVRAAMATVLVCGHVREYSWMMPSTKDCLEAYASIKKRLSKGKKMEVAIVRCDDATGEDYVEEWIRL